MTIIRLSVLALGTVLVAVQPAAAQKGTGAATGVAREAVPPSTQRMSGTVEDVKVGACERTTGRSAMGAHLMVRTEADEVVNLHLGPLAAVEHIVEQAPPGTEVSFDAFRTGAMPADAYVAKSLIVDDNVIHLRDDNLRPSWAGEPGRGAGIAPGGGRGMGPGGGHGMGPGAGQGMGPGRSHGMGPRGGQGMGPGGGGGPCWW